MSDSLQRLFVPLPDGGVFRPLVDYGALMMTNYSGALLGDGDNNQTTPGIGDAIVAWYGGRAASQTPQFVGAGVWFLVTLAALACALGLTTCRRRSRGAAAAAYDVTNETSEPPASSSTSSLNSSLLSRSSLDRRRERLLAVQLGLLAVAFVICTATLGVYWNYSGYGFGQVFAPLPRDSGGGGSLTGTVNSAVIQLNTFIEDTLVRTNSSALSACYEAFPSILDMFNRMATRYLDLLSVDFKLTPLLDTFDRFLTLVKLLLASMNAIKDSRDSVITPLNSFTTVINRTRDDIRSKVADVCATAPVNGVPLELCVGVNAYLDQLTIGPDSRRIDSDSSVTIVTLLDKIFKLNVTEIETQVKSAKSLLTGSLTLIGDEITKLFNSLVGQVSGVFAGALSSTDDLRSSMLNATQSDGFVGIFAKGDAVMQTLTALIVVNYCGLLLFLTAVIGLLVYFYYHRRGWTVARDRRQMGGNGPPASAAPGASDGGDGGGGNGSTRQPQQQLRNYPSIMEAMHEAKRQQSGHTESRHMLRMQSGMQCMRTRHMISVVFVLGACSAIIFLFGFALLYAGSEIQMDACRYLATDGGVAVVDGMLDSMIDTDLWPMVQEALATKVSIPLPVTKAMLPKGLMHALLHECSNSSVTFFQIYHLVNAFNVSDLLKVKEVQAELYKGKDMVNEMIGGLDASKLIPAEVDNILTVLPDFAKIIDTQDFSGSIAELGKPLLTLGDRVPLLIGNLMAMVRILTDRNPSDSRAILIQHFAENLNSTYRVDYQALNLSLYQMRQQFVTLQTNRIVQNLTFELTTNLAQLKLALSDKAALLSAVASRYDQVLAAYLPEMAQLLNQLLAVILTRVGQCDGIASALGIVVNSCDTSLAAMPHGGFYVALSSVILVLLCIGAMPVLRAARRDKRETAEQLEMSATPVFSVV